MSDQEAAANSLTKVVLVEAPRAVAWRVFTEQMGAWWPLATHKIGRAKAVDVIIEPQAGGRWYERGEDGSACDWGRVLAWEPPARLALSWDIDANWRHDADLKTEVEVLFLAEGPERTRVQLEHRRLDRYGPRRDEMRGVFELRAGLDRPARRLCRPRG